MVVLYTVTQTDQDLQQILELQKANLPDRLSPDELQSQGFVTLRHDLNTLRLMHKVYPHIIAKYVDTADDRDNNKNDRIIGYALCTMQSAEMHIPTLAGVFHIIESVSYQGKTLTNVPLSPGHQQQEEQMTNVSCNFHYLFMGQVCVHKEFRGKDVFAGLYQHMRNTMAPHFHGIVTAISPRNTRSLRAHSKVGFKSLHDFTSKGEDWKLVIWDFSNDGTTDRTEML